MSAYGQGRSAPAEVHEPRRRLTEFRPTGQRPSRRVPPDRPEPCGAILRGARNAVVFAAVIGTSSCHPSTTRPDFAPFRQTVVDTVLAHPAVTIDAVRQRLLADSLVVRRFHATDGYLETRRMPFDSVTGRARMVVIRVWADAAAGSRTRVTVEVTYEWTADPSRTPRDRERAVSMDHPARAYVRAILHDVKSVLNSG